jgi:hypothetical protein
MCFSSFNVGTTTDICGVSSINTLFRLQSPFCKRHKQDQFLFDKGSRTHIFFKLSQAHLGL